MGLTNIWVNIKKEVLHWGHLSFMKFILDLLQILDLECGLVLGVDSQDLIGIVLGTGYVLVDV